MYQIHKELAKQAYKKKPNQIVSEDWNLILSENNNKVYQNRRTGQVINSISGSKSTKDFLNDGLQKIGFRNNSLNKERQDETELVLRRLGAIQKKRNVDLVGHSLGGQVANKMVKDGLASSSVNFNPYIVDKSQNITDDRIVNIRNQNDFASRLIRNERNTINLDNNSNSIRSHFLDEIKL
jgi:hypothetical protein